jgi:indolepyruvate ferredoxin oxidoreductase
MLDVAKSLHVTEALEINPSDRYFYKNLLLEMVQRPCVKVIVSNKECGLPLHGRKKRDERKLFSTGKTEEVREFYQINTMACEDCRACVDMTGCPGLSQTKDAYGTKVMIDPQICVSDSYCTKIKACPSFELVKVYDYHPTKYKNENKAQKTWVIPAPLILKDLNKVASGEDYRAIVIGVGGSGVTTISRVIAEAASEMGGRDDLDFKFVDQKGLAQRNGSVTSHLSLFNKSKSQGQVVPLASADVVLSPDLLEGARAIEFLSQNGLLIVDSEYQVPLSILLDRGLDSEVMSEEVLQQELIQKLGHRLIMAPMKKMCFEKFQRPVYASAMVLGIAFQAGKLPFTLEDLEQALKKSVPKAELSPNWEAFMMGREWFENHKARPIETVSHQKNENLDLLSLSAAMVSYPWQSKDKHVRLLQSYSQLMTEHFPAIPQQHLSQYIHDILVFDQGQSLATFYQNALDLKKYYDSEALEIALRTLAKTFWIKDEVFVSHLMISPLKTFKDQKMYQDLGTSFEVVHINRPAFELWGRKIEFDFSPKPWMLKLMRHMRILRKLMPDWHKEEKRIASSVREQLLSSPLSLRQLKELDSIKGYRQYRYQNAQKYLGSKA